MNGDDQHIGTMAAAKEEAAKEDVPDGPTGESNGTTQGQLEQTWRDTMIGMRIMILNISRSGPGVQLEVQQVLRGLEHLEDCRSALEQQNRSLQLQVKELQEKVDLQTNDGGGGGGGGAKQKRGNAGDGDNLMS